MLKARIKIGSFYFPIAGALVTTLQSFKQSPTACRRERNFPAAFDSYLFRFTKLIVFDRSCFVFRPRKTRLPILAPPQECSRGLRLFFPTYSHAVSEQTVTRPDRK
jgi:hypothetical protein